MNKTKHFKRLWGTLLLLVAMLMPQGAWATDFIKEIKISVCDYDKKDLGATARNRLTNDGYKLVDADLNGGAGKSTNYVYIGYKTTTNAAEAITGLLIVESSSDPVFDAHAFDNITNANVTYNGKKYYRCDNYKVHDDGRLDCDLNRKNSDGADIVLFYTTDGNTTNGGTPLTSITVVGNTTETGVTYTRHWQYGTAQDGTSNTDVYGNTNQGNGTAHYITYTTHTHAYSSYTTTATEHDVFCSCSTQIVDNEHHKNVNGKCSVCSHDLKDWTFFYKTKSGNAIKPSWTPDFGATLLSNNYVDGQGYMNFDGPITRFNDKVFVNRTDLTGSLVIPNSVTSIGASAFENCTGLNGTLTLGSSLKSIGNKAFYYCSNLTGDLTIPNSVTSIGEYAFIGCSGFNGKLTLSNTLSSLGQRAFEECKNLTGALTIPNTLKSIPNSAFYNCSKLTSVTFHNSLTSIGVSAFNYCTAFTGTLTIPASVTSIGAKAFSYTKFSTIRNERTTPQTYDMIFGIIGGANFVNTPVKSMKLEVPSSAVAAYRAAAGWNEFKSIVCISHSYNQQNTDAAYAKVPVTCTTAGTYYYSCSVCGEKSTNSTFTVAALQHDYSVMSTDEAYHKDDATCLSAATYWKKCSRCTAKSTKDFFTSTEDKDKALGHSYGEGVWSWKWDDEEHSATCTRTCTRTTCTDKTTGHTASAKVTLNNGIDDGEVTQPATCSAMGITTYTATATVENVEYKSTNEVADIAMLPHTFDQHVCTVCSADEEPITGTQGECTWRIYASDGEMIVSPTNGVSGSLGGWNGHPSWYESRSAIKSVRFTGTVAANELSYAFYDCSAMTSIDFTNLNTSQVKDMSNLFSNCSNLTTINWGSFDTSNAHSIWYMFASCSSLTSLDLRCFNTSNVSNIRGMFDGCYNLTSVDLSSFKTDKVSSLDGMFNHCYKLTSLDLSNFNTSNVTDFHDLFWCCDDLQSLTIGNFDMSKATDCSKMFDETNKLSTLTLTSVPYLKEGTFDTKFAGKTVICQLNDNSSVYEGENYLPTITQCNHHFSVTDASVAANCGETGLTEGSHCKVCAEVLVAQEVIPNSGNHTFAANDPAQSVCTVCNHGFFRYTATAKVKPWDNTLLNADGVSIYNAEKHTFADGKGVMEFDSPLAIIDGAAFAYQNALTAIDLQSISRVGTDAFAECPNLTSVTARCDLDLSNAGINESIVTRKHDYVVMSDDETYLVSAADCIHDATYYYKCVNCIEHSAEKWTKTGTSTGIHTFAADDLAKGECTVCHHGFLRYTTSDNKVANLSQYADKKDVKSNIYANGEGVMEFNTPLGYIADNAFRNVTTLTSITIPNTVTGIGYCAFLGCKGLTGNLIIPGSVESIGQNAFNECSGLNGYVEISNPNTQMRSDAFGGCNNVTEFRIPCSVDVSNAGIASERITRIHEMMTEHPAVEAVDCGTPGNKLYYTCSRTNCQDMYYKDLAGTEAYTGKEEVFTTLPHVFAAGDTEKSECPTCHHGFFRYTSKDNAVVTPKSPAQLKAANNETLTIVSNTNVNGEGVMEFNKPLAIIGARAFEYCKDFTGKLTIPSTVTRIESNAFAHCDGFTGDLTIPNSVKDIGSVAFSDCTGFNGKLTLSNQLDSISGHAFYGCNNLTGDLVIPNSVKEIGMYAFSRCSGFNGKLSIPNSVEIIDYLAFYGCSGLQGTLTIPESVRWIEGGAFGDCPGFSSIEMRSLPYMEDGLNYAEMPKIIALNDDSYVSDDFSGDEVQSATYTRRGVKNQWGTIVMPFDVANGDDYDLYTLAGASDSEITLTKVTTTLKAGTPAVIRLKDGKAGADYTLALTGVATAESAPTTVSAELHDGTEANGLQLVGTYQSTELAAADYFISNNKFWRAADFLGEDKSVKASPFRAYLKGVTVNAKASSLSIAIGSDSTTDMLNAITEGDSEYYDLNGRRSGSLQKGVNIIKMSDGTIKKVTIK